MKVLFVNQTGEMSGAEHSLLTLLSALPGHVSPTVACPAGRLSDAVSDLNIPVRIIGGTEVSFRLHPVHTSRGLAEIARAGRAVSRLARELDVDVVHANSTRAGLIAGWGARQGASPRVVQIRDWVPEGRMSRTTLSVLAARVRALMPNSRYIAAQLPARTGNALIRVVPNAVDGERFDPSRADPMKSRARLGLARDDEVLAVVGQFTPWKGQDDAVRVLGHLASRRPRLRLLLVGSAKFNAPRTRFDNVTYERELRALVRSLGLEDRVTFLGERRDVPEVMRAVDVLLVPSWREAFGRVVVEAMAMTVPVVASNVGGPAEILRGGTDGLLATPRDPPTWARKVETLLDDVGLRGAMGASARERALSCFAPRRMADAVLDVYRQVLEAERS